MIFFNTPNGEFEYKKTIERSKFICYLSNVQDENDAKEFISKVKKKHSLATHWCYGYIIDELGQNQKFSDDGEPQGTAGVPILEVLKSKGLKKTVAVVVRYFGGIKLGTGGLSRAYSQTTLECIENAEIIKQCEAVFIKFVLAYDDYSKLLRLNSDNFKVVNSKFDSDVEMEIAIKKENFNDFVKKICDFLNKNINYSIALEGFYNFNL